MTRHIILGIIASVTLTASASKAISYPVNLTLADGTVVTATLVGDEKKHFYRTPKGEIILDGPDGYYIASIQEDDIGMAAICEATVGGDETVAMLHAFPHFGTPKALCILAEYSDTPFTLTKEQIDDALNGTKTYTSSPYTYKPDYYTTGSVAEYFNFCSNGMFRPQFEVVGPYQMSGGCTSYGKQSIKAAKEALTLAVKDGVKLKPFDNDGDDYVDMVMILYSGYGSNYSGNNSRLIWPFASSFNTTEKYDGMKVDRMLACNELFGNKEFEKELNGEARMCTGVLIHEFSHNLGLPDLYPTASWSTESYDNQSMEDWDIMDNGENTNMGFSPIPYSAWERAVMGWTAPIEELKTPADVTLKTLTDGGKALMVNNDNNEDGEYYILENIPCTEGGWYRSIPNNGMLVSHIRYSHDSFDNLALPNNVKGRPRYTILPADGYLPSTYRHTMKEEGYDGYFSRAQLLEEMKGDVYPGTKNVTRITDYRPLLGEMDKPITNIRMLDNGDVTFRFMKEETAIDGIADKDMEENGTDARKEVVNNMIIIHRNKKKYTITGKILP